MKDEEHIICLRPLSCDDIVNCFGNDGLSLYGGACGCVWVDDSDFAFLGQVIS